MAEIIQIINNDSKLQTETSQTIEKNNKEAFLENRKQCKRF